MMKGCYTLLSRINCVQEWLEHAYTVEKMIYREASWIIYQH